MNKYLGMALYIAGSAASFLVVTAAIVAAFMLFARYPWTAAFWPFLLGGVFGYALWADIRDR